MADLAALAERVIKGDQNAALAITQSALDEGLDPDTILQDGLIAGMNVIGRRFKANEVFVPEVLLAARAMKFSMDVLEPELMASGAKDAGTIVVGTVKGDLHDIGKNLVIMMLKGAGFKVIDIGIDVSTETFVEQGKAADARIIGISALLTTTMPQIEKTVKAIKGAGISAKIMIGGAPLNQEFADEIGADGYADNATTAAELARAMIA